MKAAALGFFLLIVTLFPLILGVLLKGKLADARAQKEWRQTSAMVISANVFSEEARGRRGGTRIVFCEKIVLSFEAYQRPVEAEHSNCHAFPLSRSFVEQWVAKEYRPGAWISIFYDPANPSAVVRQRKKLDASFAILTIAFLASCVLLVAIASIFLRPRRQATG